MQLVLNCFFWKKFHRGGVHCTCWKSAKNKGGVSIVNSTDNNPISELIWILFKGSHHIWTENCFKTVFWYHFLTKYRELNSELFLELVLPRCQEYILKLIPKIFETTNDGAHPTGTAFYIIKIKKKKIQTLRQQKKKKIQVQSRFFPLFFMINR